MREDVPPDNSLATTSQNGKETPPEQKPELTIVSESGPEKQATETEVVQNQKQVSDSDVSEQMDLAKQVFR